MSSQNVVDLRKQKAGSYLADQPMLPLRPQKRISPVRAQRRRTRIIWLSIITALLIDAALTVSYASYLPKYSIEQIHVQGTQQVPADLVAEYAESVIYDGSHHFLSRANFFLYPQSLIEKDVPLEFPRIASAVVDKSFLSNSITVNVIERQTFALWCPTDVEAGGSNGSCYDMDKTGFLFAQASADASSSAGYVLYGGIATSSPPIGQTFASGHTQGLVAFLGLLGQTGYTPLGATVESDQDFVVPLSQGFSVYASFGEDPGTLVSNLQLVLSSSSLSGQQPNLEYIDLRFGDKVYYKLRGQSQAKSQASSQI